MPKSEFPERIYTSDEVRKAKELVDAGYKHALTVEGSQSFKQKVEDALQLVRTAGCYDFLRTYIRQIVEIDGLTQLRNADVAIWANTYAVANSVDAASVFVQKASIMKEYLELKNYYSGEAEKRGVKKRIIFLKTLREKSTDKRVIAECERLLRLWREGSLVY